MVPLKSEVWNYLYAEKMLQVNHFPLTLTCGSFDLWPARYADLLTHVPDKMKQDWYIERILDKLSKYGMVSFIEITAHILTYIQSWYVTK